MKSLTLTVLRTIAEELASGGPAPTFTVDHIIAKVWDRNWKELLAEGFTPDDLRAIAVGAWNYAESSDWTSLQGLLGEAVGEGGSVADRSTGFARAGILELPSGRWAWIAPDHDGFVHVSLQLIGQSTERMEGAVREEDFSPAEVERIARDPSIRWWWDRMNDVTWEMRTMLRMAAQAARELTFSHVTLGTRSVAIADDVRLGELTEATLHRLLKRAEGSASDVTRGNSGFSATA